MSFKFQQLEISGPVLITLPRFEDTRGFFQETYKRSDFIKNGIDVEFTQDAQSFSNKRGTLRGLHYQLPPHGQGKLVRVVQGAVLDIIVDLRKNSSTYLKWVNVELSVDNRLMLYIPPGFAHGLITLIDQTHVLYKLSGEYMPGSDRGIRWNDPQLNIDWGHGEVEPSPILSAKDAGLPFLDEAELP